MLKLTGIKKDYVLSQDDVVHALRGVSLDFRKSEFVSVLGPSGCGKTTLMNIIGGLDKYTEGDLVIDGVSTKDFSASDWDNYRNKKIGFVFQNYNLISHQTVLSNVELALTLSGISLEERRKRAKDALIQVGLKDQMNKKPNQLSGGQTQRVAIARALVNSPDILLADEPTGALDTVTSEQIMDLIREVAKEKLVIMVTHNPDLAERYSTRLIRMLDGEILSDSAPYDGSEEVVKIETAEGKASEEVEKTEVSEPVTSEKKGLKKLFKSRKNRTSMSFLTALRLSLKNLFTKKGRTILTSIAGSIGIIGISLILAISNGMNNYIAKMTTDTLSGNPITIRQTDIDFEAAMSSMSRNTDLEKFPAVKKLFIERILKESNMFIRNTITNEYITYLLSESEATPGLYNDFIYDTGLELNAFTNDSTSGNAKHLSGRGWQMLVNNEFLSMQYDVIGGTLPQSANDLILIVDEYNRLSDSALVGLGLLDSEDETAKEIDFDNVIGKEYYFLTADEYYRQDGNRFVARTDSEVDLTNAIKAKISGIVRINPNTDMGTLSSGMGYTKELYRTYLGKSEQSAINQWIRDNPDVNPLTGNPYPYNPISTKEQQREDMLRAFGGITVPNSISIYAKDFASKEKIKEILNAYNEGKSEDEAIIFTDMSEIIGNMLSSMVNVISYVLIGFTAISLVVSCVMIGIITYISVIERTKEIGILRAIGARKKDITRVFNAETFIIGFIAGLIGVIVTAILTVPINAIISALTGVSGIANLKFLHAIIMIIISICLTVISGLIPAFKASKKDPVLALRTE